MLSVKAASRPHHSNYSVAPYRSPALPTLTKRFQVIIYLSSGHLRLSPPVHMKWQIICPTCSVVPVWKQKASDCTPTRSTGEESINALHFSLGTKLSHLHLLARIALGWFIAWGGWGGAAGGNPAVALSDSTLFISVSFLLMFWTTAQRYIRTFNPGTNISVTHQVSTL